MKALLFALLLLISYTGFSQQCNITLQGHIEDPDTREMLSAATVLILELNKQVTTDARGNFEFKDLCPGNYSLQISHTGCKTIIEKISLTKSRHIDVDMPHEKNTLTEVTISSNKGNKNTGTKKELSGKELEKTKGQSLAEALSRLNGVTLLQAGSTVSKPVIHGLHGSRILTINNDVRQEGQQWGNEHAPEIDPFIAGKLEVIKGVDELKYGSDAIGGVILVEPRPLLNHAGYRAEINTGYFTNNRQWIASAMYEAQPEKLHEFSFRIQGTYKRGANARTAHYRLNNTGSEEKNFSLAAGWKKHSFATELFYSFFDTRLGIFEGAHIGNRTYFDSAIANNRPDPVFTGENTYQIGRPYQKVQHHLLKSKTSYKSGKNKFALQLSLQKNYREEFDIVRNSNNYKPQHNLAITTLSQELSWEHKQNAQLTHLIAANTMQQDNRYAGRYFIPAYRAYYFGGYYIGKYSKNKWELQAGARYDNKNIYTNRILQSGEVFDEYGFNFSTFATSANASFKIMQGLKTNINIGLSSRAPQANELLSNGIHHGTSTFEVGNIHLKTEKAVNINWGAAWNIASGKLSAELNLYRNQIDNFIYQQPIANEPVQTISGIYLLNIYQQNNVRLQGIDFSATWWPFEKLDWQLNYSMLRAKNIDSSDWLIRMPADRIGNMLSYHFKDEKKWNGSYITFEYNYVFKQTRTPDETFVKHDYKAAPNAYGLFNVDAGTTIQIQNVPVSISLGIRNLLNKAYRDYLNSMRYFADETGRNFQLRIKIPFQSKQIKE